MKKRLLILLLCMVCLFLCSCTCESERETAARKAGEKKAVEYLKEKYGGLYKVEESHYTTYDTGMFGADLTSDFYVDVKSKEGEIIRVFCEYDKENDRYNLSDNYQAEEITEALNTYFYYPMLAELGDYEGSGVGYNEAYEDESYGFFFRAYYDGDIEAFLKEEPVRVRNLSAGNFFGTDVFVFCKDKQEAEDKLSVVRKWMKKITGDHLYKFTFLTKECLEAYKNEETRYPGIDQEGCYYELEYYDTEPRVYEQHYVELVPGIYATANETDYVLTGDDIILTKTDMTQEELNARYTKCRYTVYGDIYEVHLSEKAKETVGEEISVYMYTDEGTIYYVPHDKEYDHAFAVASTYAMAEFHTFKEGELIFTGTVTKIEETDNQAGEEDEAE